VVDLAHLLSPVVVPRMGDAVLAIDAQLLLVTGVCVAPVTSVEVAAADGVLIFAFDDGPRSAIGVGQAILDGALGSTATILRRSDMRLRRLRVVLRLSGNPHDEDYQSDYCCHDVTH
jgi:hypothetical protein